MKKISTLEKKLNASAFAFVVAMAATSYSHAHTSHHHGQGAYVGLDAVYNWVGFKKDYGQNIFKKQAPGVNVFAGYMFHENFGAELGFEWDKKVKRDVTVGGNEVVAGRATPVGAAPASFKTTLRQSHPYLGLIAKTNVMCEENSLSLLLGAALSNIKEEFNWYSSAGVSQNIIKTFSKTKLVPLVRVSFERKFTHQFGARLYGSWKNTSKFKLLSKETGVTYETRLKDALGLGLGFVYYI